MMVREQTMVQTATKFNIVKKKNNPISKKGLHYHWPMRT